MATCGEDRSVVLWRINTSPTQTKATLRGHTDYGSFFLKKKNYFFVVKNIVYKSNKNNKFG